MTSARACTIHIKTQVVDFYIILDRTLPLGSSAHLLSPLHIFRSRSETIVSTLGRERYNRRDGVRTQEDCCVREK